MPYQDKKLIAQYDRNDQLITSFFAQLSRGNAKSQQEFEGMFARNPQTIPFVSDEVKKSAKGYYMTPETLENSLKMARADERKKFSDFMIEYYSAAVAMVLHDKLGFGQERIDRTIGYINNVYDGILKGYLTVEDIRQTLKEEVGKEYKL